MAKTAPPSLVVIKRYLEQNRKTIPVSLVTPLVEYIDRVNSERKGVLVHAKTKDGKPLADKLRELATYIEEHY